MRRLFASRPVLHVALLFVAAAFLVHSSSLLFAQTASSTASLSGTVVDPQGRLVQGATVTLTDPAHGTSRSFKTDATGTYSFSLLQPSVYVMKIVAPGFKTFEQTQIVLEVGQADSFTATLSIGDTQTVIVSSEPPLLTTDNANLGPVIEQKQMVDLPLNFRNSTSFLFLEATNKSFEQGLQGNTVDTADQDQSLMAFAGQFMGQTGFILDGTWNGMMPYNGLIYALSPDSVEEFKMQTNAFTAQYGMTDGNAVSVVSKSGTDMFHGDVYEFLRNYALDADDVIDKVNGKSRLPTRMNQFGFTAGGPVDFPHLYSGKGRTYIFGAYEGLRLGASTNTTLTTPTTAYAAGNMGAALGPQLTGANATDALCRPVYAGQLYNPFSTRSVVATCATASNTVGQTVEIRDPIAGNNIAAAGLEDPTAEKMVTYFPAPTGAGAVPVSNFFAAASVPTTSNEMTIRVDQNLVHSARVFGRFSRKWENKVQSAPFYGASDPAGPGQNNPNNRYSLVFGYSEVISPTMTGTVALGLNRWVEGNVSQGYPFKSSTLGLPSELDVTSPFFPLVNIVTSATATYQLGNATETTTPFNEGTLSIDLSKVHKNHVFSFGYQGIVSQVNGGGLVHTTFSFSSPFTAGPNPQSPATSGDAFGSFLVGAVASGSTGTIVLPAISKHYYGYYLQDDWKVSKRLTLNLGLRYDIQFAPTIRHNDQATFQPNQLNPISLQASGGPYNGQLVYSSNENRGLYHNTFTNFGPRFGFSYLALKNVVVRGGYGIFFPSEYTGSNASPGYSQTTTLVSSLNGGLNPSSTLSNPFPNGILPVIGSSEGALTDIGQSFSATVYDRPSSYVEEYSLGLQYSPTPRDVVEVSYVGNRGLKIVMSTLNLNALTPAQVAQGSSALTAQVTNPFFGLSAVAGSGCGLANAKVSAYQLMLPMPQYCDSVTNAKANIGFSNYNALDVRYTHHVGAGLTILATYTHGKMLDDTFGSTTVGLDYSPVIRNPFDPAADKSVDGSDIPNAAVISYIYQLPYGRGQKFGSNIGRPLDAVIGNWQISGISSFKGGNPIAIGGNLQSGTVYGGGQHANVVGNPNVAGAVSGNPGCAAPAKIRTQTAWYNACAFVEAAAGTYGNAPRFLSNLRNPGYDDTDLSISKWFNNDGRARVQFRVDMFNFVNHVNWGPDLSTTTQVAGTGTGNTQLNYSDIPRQIQAALKIYW